jgi:putative transcriptional regulator
MMSNHPNRSKSNPSESRNPTPAEIRAAREAANLTQTEAAALVHSPCRSWQGWEAEEGTPIHRRMHPAFWELFRLKLNSIPMSAAATDQLSDLAFRSRNALDQLLRYGGEPWSTELVEVLEKLADINDDLQHGRASKLVLSQITGAKALLDRLASVKRS